MHSNSGFAKSKEERDEKMRNLRSLLRAKKEADGEGKEGDSAAPDSESPPKSGVPSKPAVFGGFGSFPGSLGKSEVSFKSPFGSVGGFLNPQSPFRPVEKTENETNGSPENKEDTNKETVFQKSGLFGKGPVFGQPVRSPFSSPKAAEKEDEKDNLPPKYPEKNEKSFEEKKSFFEQKEGKTDPPSASSRISSFSPNPKSSLFQDKKESKNLKTVDGASPEPRGRGVGGIGDFFKKIEKVEVNPKSSSASPAPSPSPFGVASFLGALSGIQKEQKNEKNEKAKMNLLEGKPEGEGEKKSLFPPKPEKNSKIPPGKLGGSLFGVVSPWAQKGKEEKEKLQIDAGLDAQGKGEEAKSKLPPTPHFGRKIEENEKKVEIIEEKSKKSVDGKVVGGPEIKEGLFPKALSKASPFQVSPFSVPPVSSPFGFMKKISEGEKDKVEEKPDKKKGAEGGEQEEEGSKKQEEENAKESKLQPHNLPPSSGETGKVFLNPFKKEGKIQDQNVENASQKENLLGSPSEPKKTENKMDISGKAEIQNPGKNPNLPSIARMIENKKNSQMPAEKNAKISENEKVPKASLLGDLQTKRKMDSKVENSKKIRKIDLKSENFESHFPVFHAEPESFCDSSLLTQVAKKNKVDKIKIFKNAKKDEFVEIESNFDFQNLKKKSEKSRNISDLSMKEVENLLNIYSKNDLAALLSEAQSTTDYFEKSKQIHEEIKNKIDALSHSKNRVSFENIDEDLKKFERFVCF